MIDQNRDGFIDSEDLKDMLASLGEEELTGSNCLVKSKHIIMNVLVLFRARTYRLTGRWDDV